MGMDAVEFVGVDIGYWIELFHVAVEMEVDGFLVFDGACYLFTVAAFENIDA